MGRPVAERVDALKALAETDPAQRGRAFLEAVEAASDDEPRVRGAAAEALAATGDPGPALDRLGRLAKDDVPGVRYQAAAALAGTPWRGRLDVLAPLLEDADDGVAAMAADGLSHACDPRAAPVLLRLLASRRLRFGALEGLLALDHPSLPETARRIFPAFFASPFERALAAVVLARGGDAKAREWLRKQLGKRRAEERPFIVVHLASADPAEGRALIEALAQAEDDYLRESALLALVKLDRAWWARAQAAVGRFADDDPHVAAEMLLGLFDVDAERAGLVVPAHVSREDELGSAARRLRLALHLRERFPGEVLLRCG